MGPPYEPFWGFPLLDQVVVGVVFWGLYYLGWRLMKWHNRETLEEIRARHERWEAEWAAGETYFQGCFPGRPASQPPRPAPPSARQEQLDRMIDWQVETGIPFEDVPHEDLERIALGQPLGEPDVVITFPINPKSPAA